MKKKNLSRAVSLAYSAFGAMAVGMSSPALAQELPAAANAALPAVQAQEDPSRVVITSSRKRAESVQDIPTSIKVFSAKTLEDANVSQITDFIALTPNASIVKSQSAGIAFITIRGLSQVRNGEAPVALVVDGVTVPNSKSFTLELSDLQSVEILRGPQGAIYGRNAPGGAMVISTRKPTTATSGFFEVGAGTGQEKYVKGAVSGQIVPDTLDYRLGGSYTDRDGYFKNDNLGGQRMDPNRDTTVRGTMRWTPTDKLSIEARAMGARTRAGANNFQAQTILYDKTKPCQLDPVNPFGGPAADPNHVSRSFCNSYVGNNDRDVADVSLKGDYSFDFGTATIVASYNRVKEFEAGTQYPYTATRNLFGVLNGSQTQYTDDEASGIEARLVSSGNGPFKWMTGVQFQKITGFISTTTGSDKASGIRRVTTVPLFNDTQNPTLSWLADDNTDDASSVFGNAEYGAGNGLTASAGFRYDVDKRSQRVDYRQASVPAGCTAGNAGRCEKQKDFSSFQPTASLRYAFSPEAQVYATVGKGFRSGRFNQDGAAAAAQAAGIGGVKDLVDQETTKSFEIGFKREHNGVRLEGAAFRTVVTGQHYFLFLPAISAQVLANIDKVTLTGGEIEAALTLAKGLDAYAGVGVTDSEINRYALNPSAVGNKAPYVPNASLNVGMQYRFPITGTLNGMLRVDGISKGKQYWDPENNGARDTVRLVNLNAEIEDVKGKWAVHAAITNLSDRQYNEEFVAGGFATPAVPRVVRVSFRQKF